jgi:hypothetical protein
MSHSSDYTTARKRFVINALPTKLHGIISQNNVVFLFTACAKVWDSKKVSSESLYFYIFCVHRCVNLLQLRLYNFMLTRV